MVPETVVMIGVPGPEVWARLTFLPGTPLPVASFKVTVMVAASEPSAGTTSGEATTVEVPALTAPTVKVTLAVWVMATFPSVTSVAANTSGPAVVEATVKVACPFTSEVPETVAMTGAPGPDVLAKVTVFPETGLLCTSFKVTVIVDLAEPSAKTEVGAATTVEVPTFATEPGKKLTVAVCVITRFPSVTSVAANAFVPGVVELTVNVA